MLTINFPPVAYLDNQDSQNFLLDAVYYAVIAYSHTVQTVIVLELLYSRWQRIFCQSEDAGIQPFKYWFGDRR